MKNLLLALILIFCSSSNMIYANNLENEDLKLPLPMPYKGVLIDKNTLDKFVESAINNNKKPMLVFGANWCGDCRILFGTFELPTFKKMLDENYSILKIDVKRYEINIDSSLVKKLVLTGFTTTSISGGGETGYIVLRKIFTIAKGRVGVS